MFVSKYIFYRIEFTYFVHTVFFTVKGTKSTSRTKQTHSRPFVFKMKSDEFVEELSINSEKALSVNSEGEYKYNRILRF